MKRGSGVAVLVAGATMAGCASKSPPRPPTAAVASGGASVQQEPNPDIPKCVRYWAEARYRVAGYDHVVTIANDCEQQVRCDVSTSVDPPPIRVEVPAKELRELITRVGSPSRVFIAYVTCAFAEGGAGVPAPIF